jgi:hypothetical protein
MVLKSATTALFLVCCGLANDAWGGSTQTYLSLGDSLAFGETDSMNPPSLAPYSDPSDGKRGFVAMYADYLGSRYGTRPDVINLSVDGEATTSFTTGVGRVPPGAGFTDAEIAELNLHYTGLTPPTQASH